MQTETSIQVKFRFSSKKEYERELSRLISLKNSPKTKRTKVDPKPEALEEQYDTLLEEYLTFCSTETDGR